MIPAGNKTQRLSSMKPFAKISISHHRNETFAWNGLTHFWSMFPFYTSWKHQKLVKQSTSITSYFSLTCLVSYLFGETFAREIFAIFVFGKFSKIYHAKEISSFPKIYLAKILNKWSAKIYLAIFIIIFIPILFSADDLPFYVQFNWTEVLNGFYLINDWKDLVFPR